MFKSIHCLDFMIYVQLIYIYIYFFSIIFEVSAAKVYGGVWVLYLSEVYFLEKLFLAAMGLCCYA